MFKVFVKIWDADRYDYVVGEYSGKSWEKKEDAKEEMKEALMEELHVWIEEV